MHTDIVSRCKAKFSEIDESVGGWWRLNVWEDTDDSVESRRYCIVGMRYACRYFMSGLIMSLRKWADSPCTPSLSAAADSSEMVKFCLKRGLPCQEYLVLSSEYNTTLTWLTLTCYWLQLHENNRIISCGLRCGIQSFVIVIVTIRD